ncbi:MAG: extracellular solute-binding protein [Candidatus Rokubacteria bacterium]|nr:extracellular solute-binding protein [Candidatus Rokubacteria bacterium]
MSRHGSGIRVAAPLWLALGVAIVATALGLAASAEAQKVAPITIVINQSPWFGGFRGLVEAYEKETGNRVTLDVNPFAGSLEKQRNSVRAKEGSYDLLIMNGLFFPEFYLGGFVVPLTNLDPGFKLDPQVATFDDTPFWDARTKTTNGKTGKLMSVPINPNIPLLYYRADLYEKAGLKVPETWDELLANAKKLHNPPTTYGIVQRGSRETTGVTYDWFPYLNSFGGKLFKDEKNGDYTVTVNSPEAKKALDFYLQLAREAGHPQTGAQTQSQVIQNLVTGKAAQAIVVIAAWAQMDDPNRSAVVGKINFAVPPHAPGYKPAPPLGHWLGGIAHNVPRERQMAVLAFLKWFQTREAQETYTVAGGPPVRLDVLHSDLSKKPEFRWMKPLADGLLNARQMWTVPEGAQLTAVLDLRLNQAVTGELTSAAALNTIAAEIHDIMQKAGYKTGRLSDLK